VVRWVGEQKGRFASALLRSELACTGACGWRHHLSSGEFHADVAATEVREISTVGSQSAEAREFRAGLDRYCSRIESDASLYRLMRYGAG
jgi:hypothetical protein